MSRRPRNGTGIVARAKAAQGAAVIDDSLVEWEQDTEKK